jgi:hypothetical protein
MELFEREQMPMEGALLSPLDAAAVEDVARQSVAAVRIAAPRRGDHAGLQRAE